MKHWMMRAIIRDRRTNEIRGYGEPFTMPPAQAKDHLLNDALYWDLVEKDVEVPDDDRGNPHRSDFVFKPAASVSDLGGGKGRRA